MWRRMTGIREHTKTILTIAGHELQRFACVVGDGVRGKFEFADREWLGIATKMQPYVFAVATGRLKGTEAEPDRNAMAAGEFEYAADVIGVFMGDDDTIDVTRQKRQAR